MIEALVVNGLTVSQRRPLSYRNQSTVSICPIFCSDLAFSGSNPQIQIYFSATLQYFNKFLKGFLGVFVTCVLKKL